LPIIIYAQESIFLIIYLLCEDMNRTTVVFLALFCFVVWGGVFSLVSASNQTYQYVFTWGSQGSLSGLFENPAGIAVDMKGDLYVADTGNNRVQKFNSTGGYLLTWGSYGSNTSQFKNLSGIATDICDDVYVTDTGNNRIQKFSSTGVYLLSWGINGSNTSQFVNPSGIATDTRGDVYVVDTGNNRIQKFSSVGQYLTGWGSAGANSSEFNSPVGVAVYQNGSVYVVDRYNSRVQKFNLSGYFLGSLNGSETLMVNPQGVAVDCSGNVYVTDTDLNSIRKFNLNSSQIATWGGYGTRDGYLNNPEGIAVNTSGFVYVCDTYNNRIQVFSLYPSISSVTPSSAQPGSTCTLTINGTNFELGSSTVSISGSGVSVGSFSTRTETQIVCQLTISSTASQGVREITVTNPGTNASATGLFTITGPSVLTIQPAFGHSTGPLPVTITGQNLTSGKVTLQKGDKALSGNWTLGKTNTSSTLYVTLPLKGASTGVYNLTVKIANGSSVTKYDAFTVLSGSTVPIPRDLYQI